MPSPFHDSVQHGRGLVSFESLGHVLIQKLQDLDRMPIKKYSTKKFDFPATDKNKSLLVPDNVIKNVQFELSAMESLMVTQTKEKRLVIVPMGLSRCFLLFSCCYYCVYPSKAKHWRLPWENSSGLIFMSSLKRANKAMFNSNWFY